MRSSDGKTVLLATALVLLCNALLLSGALLLAYLPVKDRPLTEHPAAENGWLPETGDTTLQAELSEKFSVYNHVQANGKKLTLFSDKQIEEVFSQRQAGTQPFLTYEEILFLINDSIRLYNTYDEIVLTDPPICGATIRPSQDASQSILPYHGDLEALPYDLAMRKYQSISDGIYDIILYRLAMLDPGFLQRLETDAYCAYLPVGDVSEQTDAGQYIRSVPEEAPAAGQKALSAYFGALVSDRSQYGRACYERQIHPQVFQLSSPMLLFDPGSDRSIRLIHTDYRIETVLFPTVELVQRKPFATRVTDPDSCEKLAEYIRKKQLSYATDTQTVAMEPSAYLNAEDYFQGITIGTTLTELLDVYGLFYDRADANAGCYYTTDGGVVYMTFDTDYTVTDVKLYYGIGKEEFS